MSAQATESRFTGGASTLWNLVISPSTAFDALRERPTWGVALVVVTLATVIATLVMMPAVQHAVAASLPSQMAADPRYASMTADERAQVLTTTLIFVRFAWIWTTIVVIACVCVMALVLMAAAAIGRGSVSFPRSFALAANVGVIWFALAQLVTAAIVALRGPDAFVNPFDVNLSLPSLAWFASAAPQKTIAFLSGINPFTLWSFFLLGAGTAAVAGVGKPAAYGASAFLILCACLLGSLAAR